MNREELKKTLKPLIKQCIKEVLFEEAGVLSKVVSEVAQGLNSNQRIVESVVTSQSDEAEMRKLEEKKNQALQQQKERMLQAIGESSYNGVDLFEGTTPMSSSGSTSNSSAASPMGPMKDIDPNDPGVDIHSIPGLNMDIAKKLMG
tara:strand:- start:503 stop:940 length:438 start_codon:yes stop_codon:yes gene_type:complete